NTFNRLSELVRAKVRSSRLTIQWRADGRTGKKEQIGMVDLAKREELPDEKAAVQGHRKEAEYDPPERVFSGFCKIDKYKVRFRRYDGKMEECTRLNFERGDAVGVLLFNVDTRSVVLVEQFKLPTLIGRQRDDPKSQNGWIEETMAGMIRDGE